MATLISQVKSHVTSYNTQPKVILTDIALTIDHMFNHNDWTPLAWLLAKIENKADQGIVRHIVGECVGGLTLISKGKLAKEQPSGLYLKRGANCATTGKMETLRDLVKDGESFRGKAVREQILGKDKPEFKLEDYLKRVIKKIESEGFDFAALERALHHIEIGDGHVNADLNDEPEVIKAKAA